MPVFGGRQLSGGWEVYFQKVALEIFSQPEICVFSPHSGLWLLKWRSVRARTLKRHRQPVPADRKFMFFVVANDIKQRVHQRNRLVVTRLVVNRTQVRNGVECRPSRPNSLNVEICLD